MARRGLLAGMVGLAFTDRALAQGAIPSPPPGRGQGGGNGPGGPPGRGGQGGPPAGQGPAASPGRGPAVGPPPLPTPDRARIQAWYRANPGFVARPLPPGIMRQLARGRPLPPGIARQVAPPGLLALLPSYPGHGWYVVGTAVVLVDLATGVVRDLLLDALVR